VTATALLLAVLVTPSIASFGKLFAFIQEYTGFVTPGVLCIFLLGIFWRKMSPLAALVAVLMTIPVSLGLKLSIPQLAFLDRMTITFIILVIISAVISLAGSYRFEQSLVDSESVRPSNTFIFGALLIVTVIAVFYIVFW
jgi:SSS family solute:Na+ symporter